ncbi:MAG TPA: hypothetical protein VMI34_18060 [Candidatus Bathyarchaeia archaeon]|nr:hypothetical protein [Candidatus Bathyarchaeia archaeon]
MTRAIWLPLCLVLLLMGCASAPVIDRPTHRPVAGPSLRFGVDTLAFANEIRWKNPDKTELYANYCFVMARAVTQFHRFARFDPDQPRVAPAVYEELVSEVVARGPWEQSLPPEERVVIPGYASLHEFSAAQEEAVKGGLGTKFWTMVHWTNWRVFLPWSRAQQERVASETLDELDLGHPVQLLVTNLPKVELNHTVVAYDYRLYDGRFLEFIVYDPNEPNAPGWVAYDRADRRFFASGVYDTEPGLIRAFRMYYSPLL